MVDILADFKKSRFVVLEPKYFEPWGLGRFTVLLTDITFWNDNFEDLTTWCQQHGGETYGMTVSFPDEKTLTLFALRWS